MRISLRKGVDWCGFTRCGQEILDQDGTVVAWTTDAWLAQVICKLLSDNEELLRRKEEKDGTR